MFRDAFVKLDRMETEAVLEEINPAFTAGDFDPSGATILSLDLAFYPGYRLFEIADHGNVPPLKKNVIYRPGHVTVLDWTNGPVYALNEKAPIALNEKNVTDYIKFFLGYIRGRHGRFIIVESVDDISWREEPPPSARKAVGSALYPVTIRKGSGKGPFELDICVLFKEALFRTRAQIAADGLVSLTDEELLIEDMPVLSDAFTR